MKKIFAFILVMAMLFALAACGSDKNENKGSLFGDNGGSAAAPTVKLSRGFTIGDTYTNTFADITFNKPGSWSYYSDEELAALMGTTSEQMGIDFEQLLESTGSAYDMMAVDPATGTNVIVMFENLASSNSTGMSEREYAANLKVMLNSTGIDYTFGGEKNVYLGGQKYFILKASSTQYGTAMDQIYYIRIVGNYVVGVIATLVNTPAATVEAMFS